MTVASNLKDFPPLGSLHRAGISEADQARWNDVYTAGIHAEAENRLAEAATNYTKALALDSHFAELHFQLARVYYGLGQRDIAREEFVLARDWDALPFRADSRLNSIIRDTAAQATNGAVRLLDAELALAGSEPDGIPGERFFYDHVHPNFEGDYLLARALLPAVIEHLASNLAAAAPQSKPILSREECAARLAFTPLNEAQLAAAMVQATALPPFTAQLEHAARQKAAEQQLTSRFGSLSHADLLAASEVYRAAMKTYPEDWELPYCFARLLLPAREYEGAIEQFGAAKRLLPHCLVIRLDLSSALNTAGRYEKAFKELTEARILCPDSEAVKTGLAAVESHLLPASSPR